MTVLSLRAYAIVTVVLGIIQVVYHALWIGAPGPPFGTPDWLIAVELAWTLVSLEFTVRLRRRALPAAVPASYALYTLITIGYTSWLASTSGTGGVTEEMIPLWWKLGAVGVGAWFIAGAVSLFALTFREEHR